MLDQDDHAGPHEYAPGEGMRVGPHPHIGLQTFTWMIEGEVVHHDSLGYEQVIRPGQVNPMTAGRGIAHAEESATPGGGRLHAAQLWIALPDRERQRAPAFQHCPDLPRIDAGGFAITVLAGSAASLILVLGFALHLVQDRRLAGPAELPTWYLPLLWRLTVVAGLCLLANAWHGASHV